MILRAELIAASVATAHNLVLRQWLRQGGTSDPFVKLDEALSFVRSNFLGSPDSDAPIQNHSSDNTTLVIMAFDESVKNETITRELEKIRRSVKPEKPSLAGQSQSGRP